MFKNQQQILMKNPDTNGQQLLSPPKPGLISN